MLPVDVNKFRAAIGVLRGRFTPKDLSDTRCVCGCSFDQHRAVFTRVDHVFCPQHGTHEFMASQSFDIAELFTVQRTSFDEKLVGHIAAGAAIVAVAGVVLATNMIDHRSRR